MTNGCIKILYAIVVEGIACSGIVVTPSCQRGSLSSNEDCRTASWTVYMVNDFHHRFLSV